MSAVATVVSERYALSLYEVAKAENLAADMCEALGEVSEIFSAYPDYLKVLTTPSISPLSAQLFAAFNRKAQNWADS